MMADPIDPSAYRPVVGAPQYRVSRSGEIVRVNKAVRRDRPRYHVVLPAVYLCVGGRRLHRVVADLVREAWADEAFA
jgi:hypothetical protein